MTDAPGGTIPPAASDSHNTDHHTHHGSHAHPTSHPAPARLQVPNASSPASSSSNQTPEVPETPAQHIESTRVETIEPHLLGTSEVSSGETSHTNGGDGNSGEVYGSEASSTDHDPGPQLHDPYAYQMSFFVLLPMVCMIRDMYETVLSNHRHQIDAYVQGGQREVDLKASVDAVLEKLKRLCDYEDMNISGHISPSQRSIAKWAETCSTKCQFLCALFESLKDENKHVVILAKPGRLLDVIEAIVNHYGYDYTRPGHPQLETKIRDPDSPAKLRITLLPTGNDGIPREVTHADLVIAYDSTFRNDEIYSAIARAHPEHLDQPSPLISLIVSHSVEHLDVCIPDTKTDDERRALLLNCLDQTVQELGKLEPEIAPDQAARDVATWLVSSAEASTWPLLPVEAPKDVDVASGVHFESESGSAPQEEVQEEVKEPLTEDLMHPKIGLKRPMDSEPTDTGTPKRQRTSSPVLEQQHVQPSVDEIFVPQQEPQLSLQLESQLEPPTEPQMGPQLEPQVEPQLGDLPFFEHTSEFIPDQPFTINPMDLSFQMSSPEVSHKLHPGVEQMLREQITKLETRIKAYETSFRRFAKKYAQSRDDINKLAEADGTQKTELAALRNRLISRTTEADSFKEKHRLVKVELEEARALLTQHEDPKVSSEAKLQAENEELKAEIEKLKKQLATMTKNFDFTRDEYQKASSRAYELNSENSKIQNQLQDLQRADGQNRLFLAEFNRDTQRTEDAARIDELMALLEERNLEIVKLRSKLNGRRETRGPSVPRSPMLGVAGTGGTNSPRAAFMGAAVGRSRGNSPITTDTSGTQFSHSRDSSGRWGHLAE